MRKPTREQDRVLESDSRVRVVRASPGSGKTWLVAEIIRRELEDWKPNGCGIAALSFTRVGGDEIRKAVGHDLPHPHFVGTLDSFVLRYIVIPFLTKAWVSLKPPRLIPADWAPTSWSKGPNGTAWEHRGQGGKDAKTYSLFDICFIGEREAKPIIACRSPYRGGLDEIAEGDRQGVWAAKKESWKKYGWITHSDAAFLAAALLYDETHGPTICSEITRRFPLIIVDELQDTGFYLGKCILAILSQNEARGVLVGDPDQAIFEFNGARPDLFGRFESISGAITLPLDQSRRCPASVANAATHLKQSGDKIDPAPDKNGRAFLVHYETMKTDIEKITKAIGVQRPGMITKVVTRMNSTVEELLGRKEKTAKKLGCPTLNHIQRAVLLFRQGRQVAALAAARAAIDLAVLGHEGVTDEDLRNKKIDPCAWKELAVRCLLLCNTIPTSGTIHEWQVQAGTMLDKQIGDFVLESGVSFATGKLKPRNLNGGNRGNGASADYIPQVANATEMKRHVPIQTVHAVKGETHDVTILVCPDPKKPDQCPSAMWWSIDSCDQEEKRIAYVAMTRTRGDLLVCVSASSMDALRRLRSDFVDSFECFTVNEFIQNIRFQEQGQNTAERLAASSLLLPNAATLSGMAIS